MFYLVAYFAAKRISGNKDFILNNSVALAKQCILYMTSDNTAINERKTFLFSLFFTFPRFNMQNSVHF